MRMAVVRDIEPWDELLAAGREDERLVMQAAQNRRRPRAVALPDELHPEVAEALRARGVEQLWSHQAEALHAAWAGPTIVTTGTASGKSLCFQLPDARHAVPRRARPGALPLPDEGARAGPGARAARRSASSARGRRSTTATRRASSARRSGGARTSSSPTPTCCTSGSCPTTARGRTCSPTSRSSWSTRRTSTAACSARTSPTCCGGCGGSPPPTGPSRASCSRARRSPTRASSPSA